MEVEIFPLIRNALVPVPAPAKTRPQIPPGYGVQEQCLPFTAATALGLLIRSPIDFGLCPPGEVPADSHSFRSPLDRPRIDGVYSDQRVFYVKDNPGCRFVKNAFTLDELEVTTEWGKRPYAPLEPGISFFDREDQNDLFKLHLPYVWRTPLEVDTLFLPAVNRPLPGFTVLCGLVETDWYANPVNLVVRKLPGEYSLHVSAGDPIAQAILLMRAQRRSGLKVIASHARAARGFRRALAEWYRQRADNRAAYKTLARSHHGRISSETGEREP